MKTTNHECEMLIDNVWAMYRVADILPARPPARCPACHRRARLHNIGKNNMAAHFEHLGANCNCPYSYKFKGATK